jgi:hypothetical protein
MRNATLLHVTTLALLLLLSTAAFGAAHVQSVGVLSQELNIGRSVLYRWCDSYRREGVAGIERGTDGPLIVSIGLPHRNRRPIQRKLLAAR